MHSGPQHSEWSDLLHSLTTVLLEKMENGNLEIDLTASKDISFWIWCCGGLFPFILRIKGISYLNSKFCFFFYEI